MEAEAQVPEVEVKPEIVPEVVVETKPEGKVEAKPEGKAEPEPAPKLSPDKWREKKLLDRVASLTKTKSQLEAQLANQQVAKAAPIVADPADLDARVDALAEAKAAQRLFDAKCLEVVKEGKAAFADFDDRVKDLQQVADLSDPKSQAKYTSFIDAIIETGDGARLIHDLALDPEEAERIFALPPVKQGIALAKLAAVVPEPVSGAPKPITPVGGRAASREPIDPRDKTRADKLATAEWMARRNAQVEADFKARRGY